MAKAPFVSEADKKAFWHATSHVLADAVKRLWPNVKLGIGPAIDEGFYYDFDKKEPFTPVDITRIEAEMKRIIKEDKLFKQSFMTKKEAEKFLAKEPYKLDLLKDVKDKKVEFHQHGNFIDLCNNALIKSAGQIKAFKLMNTAAAYWRGDSKKPILQRIYGISFPEKEMLDAFLKRREEAEKRDHLKLGPQLELFEIFPQTIGSGLPLWLPKGAVVRRVIEDYWKTEHDKRGYKFLYSMHIGKKSLWEKSGHWALYKDFMYPSIKIEAEEYLLKPMNCPLHIHAYMSKPRSYRDLPIKLCELATVYRHEVSGALHGLVRVRGITQDDAHIFCSVDQLPSVLTETVNFALELLRTFGFEDFSVQLSLRDPKAKAKYLGHDEIWNAAETTLRKVLQKNKIKFSEDIGEAAFYGPKVDVMVKDALGREWQCSTVQVDFNLPERFNLSYTGADNRQHRPVLVHRALLGSIERFMGVLIEHYGGAFPAWLAPVQVKLLTFTDRNLKYAEKIERELKIANLRIESDYSNNTVEYKVRAAELEKVPYILVVGDKEEKNRTIAVRPRGGKVKFGIKTTDFIKQIIEEVEKKI